MIYVFMVKMKVIDSVLAKHSSIFCHHVRHKVPDKPQRPHHNTKLPHLSTNYSTPEDSTILRL